MLPWIFITYDIGCQWSKNLQSRMSEFPEHMRLPPETKVAVAIPSWHITSHGRRCRKDFCLGYTKGAGRTCGEEVEITWSSTNSLAPSVREMAPGARHDTLNDQWNGWNFRKIVGFRKFSSFFSHLFLRFLTSFWTFQVHCLRNVSKKRFSWARNRRTYLTSFRQHSHVRPSSSGNKWLPAGKLIRRLQTLTTSLRLVSACPNDWPWQNSNELIVTTLQDMWLQLTQKETLELMSGRKPKHKVTMMGYFSMGFDIEDQQWVLRQLCFSMI